MGARIASIIRARESLVESSAGASIDYAELSNPSSLPGPAENMGSKDVSEHHSTSPKSIKRPSRHRVIIHTSPFLRCVQTSIAISAGMAQWNAMIHSTASSKRHRNSQGHAGAARLHSVRPLNSLHLAAIPEPIEESDRALVEESVSRSKDDHKASMRIDAFLGEWLQPDYFELISQPPDSKLMVAGAKAELLRPGDYSTIPGSTMNSASPSVHGFPGGWASPPTAALSNESAVDGSFSSLSSIGDALPRRDRASSYGSAGPGGRGNIRPSSKIATNFHASTEGYTPPTPTYAVSPADPIPAGYVAHARDACIQVDYQWDSMRSPQCWGDGGEYGEEWAAMHKRFRRGLQEMIDWYRKHDASVTSSSADNQYPPKGADDRDATSEDDGVETVLVLVTHGAGCNALLGALTDSPVLMDIGMASLTMAVRKDVKHDVATTNGLETHLSDKRSAFSTHISEEYDVKLSASTEHLRAGSNPLNVPQLQVRGVSSPQIHGSYRHRVGSGTSSSLERPFSIGEPHRSGVSTGIGSIRRVANSSSPFPRAMSTSVTSNGLTGLWSPHMNASAPEGEPGDDMVLNFGDTSSDDSKANESPVDVFPTIDSVTDEKINGKEERQTDPFKHTDINAPSSNVNSSIVETVKPQYQGLWGTAIAVRELGSQKEKPTTRKRRWTVDEHTPRV